MEKNKENKSTGKTVAIIVLAVLLLGAASYIGYDKFFVSKNNEKVESKQNKKLNKEELDINSDLVQRLFNIFRLDQACYMTVDNLNNNNLVKLRLAYNNLSRYNFSEILCSEVGANEVVEGSYCGEMNDEMSSAYGSGDMNKFNEATKSNYTTSLDANILRRKVKELFGSDIKVKDEDFGLNHNAEPFCHLMHYDKEKDLYAKYACEGGGSCGPGPKQTVKKAIKTGEKIEIVTDLFNEGDNKTTTVTYYFKFDKENYNYVFDKVEES